MILDDQTIREYQPKIIDNPGNRQAAIALVVCGHEFGDELLFIQRAKSKNDPWSGQVACPGGGKEDSDGGLIETAVRETFEETGLELSQENLIGRLDDQVGSSRSREMALTISAFIFRIHEKSVLAPNYEVAEAFWSKTSHLTDPDRQVLYQTPFGEQPRQAIYLGDQLTARETLIEYSVQEKILWGLTHRFVNQLLAIHGVAGH